MIYFKSCKKCETGDVEHNSDWFGEFFKCYQCGYTVDSLADLGGIPKSKGNQNPVNKNSHGSGNDIAPLEVMVVEPKRSVDEGVQFGKYEIMDEDSYLTDIDDLSDLETEPDELELAELELAEVDGHGDKPKPLYTDISYSI